MAKKKSRRDEAIADLVQLLAKKYNFVTGTQSAGPSASLPQPSSDEVKGCTSEGPAPSSSPPIKKRRRPLSTLHVRGAQSRLACLLIYGAQLPAAQVGELMGVSAPTAKRLAKAAPDLQEQLEKHPLDEEELMQAIYSAFRDYILVMLANTSRYLADAQRVAAERLAKVLPEAIEKLEPKELVLMMEKIARISSSVTKDAWMISQSGEVREPEETRTLRVIAGGNELPNPPARGLLAREQPESAKNDVA